MYPPLDQFKPMGVIQWDTKGGIFNKVLLLKCYFLYIFYERRLMISDLKRDTKAL